jgi:gamma-glutamylcyclotransferase (GGCT)/AIG2-like uncharacterized protein YtfP
VYGTLRRDADTGMARMLAQAADFVGAASFQGQLFLVDDYPGAVPGDDPRDIVVGDLYRMHDPEMLLSQLDAYEGYDAARPDRSEFVRRIVTVTLSKASTHPVAESEPSRTPREQRDDTGPLDVGSESCVFCLNLAAWIYLYNQPVTQFRRIASGDFLDVSADEKPRR